MANRMVRQGKATWKDLERRGVVLESRQGQHEDSTAAKRRQYLNQDVFSAVRLLNGK